MCVVSDRRIVKKIGRTRFIFCCDCVGKMPYDYPYGSPYGSPYGFSLQRTQTHHFGKRLLRLHHNPYRTSIRSSLWKRHVPNTPTLAPSDSIFPILAAFHPLPMHFSSFCTHSSFVLLVVAFSHLHSMRFSNVGTKSPFLLLLFSVPHESIPVVGVSHDTIGGVPLRQAYATGFLCGCILWKRSYFYLYSKKK